VVLAAALLLPHLWRAGLAAALFTDSMRPGHPGILSHFTPRPVRIGTRVRMPKGISPADLYLPGAAMPREVILLVHGLNETGKDDERLVSFAFDLARTGAAVLVPDFPNLRHARVRPSDADAVALAYEDLADRFREKCRPGRARACGLMAFSYGVGPALLAAAEPRVRDRIGFVVGFGGYADLEDVIRFVTTGHASDRRVHAVPYPWAKWAFLAANADLATDAADRARLEEIARAKLDNDRADVHAAVEALGPDGRAIWNLLTNRDPTHVHALLEKVNPKVREMIAALSPLPQLAHIRARLLLLHGVADRSIPFTESVRLARAAPDPSRVTLTLTRIFGHVDPDLPDLRGPAALRFYIPEVWRMIRFADAILSQGC
jgi:pimeloyl-ACP methyl ester carboxylesterase